VSTVLGSIDPELAGWLERQPVFFVATAPLDAAGHVNCSPKGTAGTFKVLGPHRVAYLDLTGSGVETIAHVRENGRIVVMFCAFEGKPDIVRLHGTASIVENADTTFGDLAAQFPQNSGARAVVVVDVTRVSSSCGYAVPRMTYVEDRRALDAFAAKRGADGLVEYRAARNAESIDGLPGFGTHGR
jgi:hypothetical protein